jgi:hypothetical protein
MRLQAVGAAVLLVVLVGCRFDPSGVPPGDVGSTVADTGLEAGHDLFEADGPGTDGPPATDAPVTPEAGQPDGPVAPDGPATPDGPVTPDALPCPIGYTQGPTGCHRAVSATADWLTAEKNCEQDGVGAHLVVVDNAAENSALPDNVWIGLSERVTAGVFLTVTGQPQGFTAYAPGEPVSGGAACVESRPDGWHDDNCYEQKKYVCEFDGVPASSSAY